MLRQYIAIAMGAVAMMASAQSLNKEIVIDREIDPTLRAVTRINTSPAQVQPKIESKSLTFSDMTTAVEVPAMIDTLAPAAPAEAVAVSPWRGYAALGYFPEYNLGGSVGYRIVESSKTRLGAWLQFDGRKFDGRKDDDDLQRNTLTAAVDFAHVFDKAGRVDVDLDFTFDAVNRPWVADNPTDNAYDFNIKGVWSGRRSNLAYFGSASVEYFSLGGADTQVKWINGDPKNGESQAVVGLKAGASLRRSDNVTLAATVTADAVRYSDFNVMVAGVVSAPDGSVAYYPAVAMGGGKTMGVVTLNPTVSYRSGALRILAGVKGQLTVNSGKALHVAPDVRFEVSPSDFFTAMLRLGGGEHINRLSTLYMANPWGARSGVGYGISHMPLTADLELLVGPFKGASLRLFGGYAASNDRLMPEVYGADLVGYRQVDLSAFHYGAEASVSYNKLLTASVRFSGSPNTYRHSNYAWADRAKSVFDVKVTVNPIERLSVDAGFELRSGRMIYMSWMPDAAPMALKLKTSNSLNLGATYSLKEQISLFARVENILNNRAAMLCLRDRQGLTGLVGATLKF